MTHIAAQGSRTWAALSERECDCGRPGCPGRFLPTHPRQRYATAECRAEGKRRYAREYSRNHRANAGRAMGARDPAGPEVAGALAELVLIVNGPKPPIPTRDGLAAALRTLHAAETFKARDGRETEDVIALMHDAELQIAAWGLHRLVRRARARSSGH